MPLLPQPMPPDDDQELDTLLDVLADIFLDQFLSSKSSFQVRTKVE